MKYAKFCPKCKSLNIKTDFKYGLIFLGIPPQFICRDCNYKAYMFPEVSLQYLKEMKEKQEREAEKNKQGIKRKK